MANQRQAAAGLASQVRYQGVSTIQTVKSTPGTIGRLTVSNRDAAAQTVTFTDGSTAGWVGVFPAGQTVSLDIGWRFTTSIKVTPSDTDLDIMVFYT